MIKFKVIKPGRWFYPMVLVVAAISIAMIVRGLFFAYSSVEVYSDGTPQHRGKGDGIVDSILKAALEKAFPIMTAGGKEEAEEGSSFFQGILKHITRLDYRDPKTFIIAELSIMDNYNIVGASRGAANGSGRGSPYDPEEDLEEILAQYNLGQIRIGPGAGDDQAVTAGNIQRPEKTQLTMGMPLVLIYHTHTSEAYRPSKQFNYTPTDVDRTIDPRYSVVRIGKELKDTLESRYNIKTVHITTFHDYPDYSPSYSRSLASAKSSLERYPTIKVIIDIHRDAFPMRNKSEETVARAESVMKINNKDTARLTLVWGPDAESSAETRKFAELLKDKINRQAQGLCRKVIEKSTGKYNQQLSNYAVLIEVGSNANTMEEALNAIPHLAKAVSEAIKEIGE